MSVLVHKNQFRVVSSSLYVPINASVRRTVYSVGVHCMPMCDMVVHDVAVCSVCDSMVMHWLVKDSYEYFRKALSYR
jgi:hypothetical protein